MTRRADATFELRSGPTGRPMNLAEWPAGDELPVASCKHYAAVHTSVHEARRWIAQGETSVHKQG